MEIANRKTKLDSNNYDGLKLADYYFAWSVKTERTHIGSEWEICCSLRCVLFFFSFLFAIFTVKARSTIGEIVN